MDDKGTWELFLKSDHSNPKYFSVCVTHTFKKGAIENYLVGRYPSRSLACQAISNVDPLKPEKNFKNGVIDKVKDTSKKYDPSEERWKWRARARYRNEMLHIGYYETERDAHVSLREEMEDLSNLHRRYRDLMDKRARKRKREEEKKLEEMADENYDFRHFQEMINGSTEPPKKKRKKYRKRERHYLDPMPFYSNMQHLSFWNNHPPPIKIKTEIIEPYCSVSVSSRTRNRHVKREPLRKMRVKQERNPLKVSPEWFDKCLEVVDSFIEDKRFSPFLDLHRHLPLQQKREKRFLRIDCPSTLCSCRDKLVNEQYSRIDDFINDFELIWINCRTYNSPSEACALLLSSRVLESEFFARLHPVVCRYGDQRCKQKWRNAQLLPGGFLSDSEDDFDLSTPPDLEPDPEVYFPSY